MFQESSEFNAQSSIALGHFIGEVIKASSEKMIYSILAKNLDSLIPNDRSSVTLLNNDKNMLEVFSLQGREGALPVGQCLPLETTFSGRAVLQRVGQKNTIDSRTNTDDGKKLFKDGMRCIINAPIVVHGKSIGAINTAASNSLAFNNQSLALLELVARLVSSHIEHQRLLQDREQSLERYRSYATQLENLNQLSQQLSVVKSASEIMQICENVVQNVMPSGRVSYAVYCPEDDTFKVTVLSGETNENLKVINAGGTELKKVFIEGKPLYIPDFTLCSNSEHKFLYKMGMRRSMSIPINVDGKVVGILSAASKKTDKQDDNMIQVLGAMGGIISGTMERVKANDTLNRQANYDTLTGLPNRHMFYTQLNSLFSDPMSDSFSMLFIDLDRFKNVNDTLGHQAGDELLCLVAKRICAVTREKDLVARIGGDEFVVVIAKCSLALSKKTAGRINQSLSLPFDLKGNSVSIGASIGISTSSENMHCVDDMIQKADKAMYKVKSIGGGAYCAD